MKKHLSTIFLIIIVIVGLGFLLYPSVSNYWNSLHSSRAISSYVENVAHLDRTRYEQLMAEARAYNDRLYKEGYNLVLPEPRKESYFRLLDITGTGIMGYIEIQKINVFLPIYHGTSDQVLQSAVGHIEGSFLPIGGENTHSVLSGHRGLPSSKLFTDLDKLVIGDTFSLRILDESLVYEVDQIVTVLPGQLEQLNVVPGADLCTLVTCTPYGINSHRLLVRGHRIESEEIAKSTRVPSDALRANTAVVAVFLAVPVLLALLILVLIRSPKKQKTPPADKKTADGDPQKDGGDPAKTAAPAGAGEKKPGSEEAPPGAKKAEKKKKSFFAKNGKKAPKVDDSPAALKEAFRVAERERKKKSKK